MWIPWLLAESILKRTLIDDPRIARGQLSTQNSPIRLVDPLVPRRLSSEGHHTHQCQQNQSDQSRFHQYRLSEYMATMANGVRRLPSTFLL
jgi:hypothetical protein